MFEDFMNGPLRILFPLVVALLAGSRTAAELSNRFVVNTRTRVSIRRRIAGRFMVTMLSMFVLFTVMGLINALVAFVVIPATVPESINPAQYGLGSPASVQADAMLHAPLAALLDYGRVVFALGASAWLGFNAAVFAAVTLIAVYVISRPVIALMVPFGLYVLESIVFQTIQLPGLSFLLSAVYPAGLQNYDPVQAFSPTLVLAFLTVAAMALVIMTSRRNPRLS
ncbi:hypothetical protein IV498_14760 [Paenarthrobacter sp. Z7-10]|nr:hypothetical protein [Paenarthrobacter sp. Z7-10]